MRFNVIQALNSHEKRTKIYRNETLQTSCLMYKNAIDILDFRIILTFKYVCLSTVSYSDLKAGLSRQNSVIYRG